MNKTPTFMLIGPIEAGKSTLFKALFDYEDDVRKTQAVIYEEKGAIDTPGEYFSHPRLYHALINTASNVQTLVYVHPSNEKECRIPPGLLNIYEGKQIIGVITKIDLPDTNVNEIESMLIKHGINGPIFHVTNTDPESITELKTYLFNQTQS